MWAHFSSSCESLLTGIGVGMVFAICKLQIPAPSSVAGIMGIVGIFLGYYLYTWIQK